jgi:hypothetical protein
MVPGLGHDQRPLLSGRRNAVTTVDSATRRATPSDSLLFWLIVRAIEREHRCEDSGFAALARAVDCDELRSALASRKRPGDAITEEFNDSRPDGAHHITLTGHHVDDGRPLLGGEHAPRLLPVRLPRRSTSTGPRPWATAARGTPMIEYIGPGRDAIKPPPRAPSLEAGSTPKEQPHGKETALTERQRKAPAGEVLGIRDPVIGSSRGSETGEQRCAQPHATASNRNLMSHQIHKPARQSHGRLSVNVTHGT